MDIEISNKGNCFSSYCNSSHAKFKQQNQTVKVVLAVSALHLFLVQAFIHLMSRLFIFPPLVTARLLRLFTAEASKTKLLLVRKIIVSGFLFLGSSVVLNLYSVQRSVGLLYRSQAPDGKHGVVKMKKTSVYMCNSDVYSC